MWLMKAQGALGEEEEGMGDGELPGGGVQRPEGE